MGLSDALAKVEIAQPWQVCGVKWALEALDDEDAAAFQAAVDSAMPAATLSAVLKAETGFPVNADTINRHRRGVCKCR